MTESALFTWTVVMPVKVLARAKSRLAVLAGPRRSDLALALASDTVCAALGCPEVAHVLVVTPDPVAGQRLAALGAQVVSDEPAGGLNAALAHGAAAALRRWPDTGIAALAADLPALRSAELSRALRAAASTLTRKPAPPPGGTAPPPGGTALPPGGTALPPEGTALPPEGTALLPEGTAFVADAAGVGTTLYAAPPGTTFVPKFGGASRVRHAAGGGHELDLPDIPGLRRDVDTPEDLRAAIALGVGKRTASLAGELLAV